MEEEMDTGKVTEPKKADSPVPQPMSLIKLGTSSKSETRDMEEYLSDESSLRETIEDLVAISPKDTKDVGTLILRETLRLIENAEGGGDAKSVELERCLDSMAVSVKRKVTATSSKETWFLLTVRAMMKLAWDYHWEPKPQKKIIKVITEFEKHDPSVVRTNLGQYTTSLTPDIKKEHLTKWYNFGEVSNAAREILGNHFSCVIAILNDQLGQLLKENISWTMDRQKWLQLLLKVALQLFQYLHQHIFHAVWTEEPDRNTKDVETLVSYVFNIVATEDIPCHCLPLATTTLGFLVCLADDKKIASEAFISMFYDLGTRKEISVGNLCLTSAAPGEEDLPGSSASRHLSKGSSMGHLYLLNGLLTCAKAELLGQNINLDVAENSQGTIMIEWLFFETVSLCNIPEHQYHSFKLLTSWYQRLDKCFLQLREYTSRRLFNKSSSIVQKTLALVWTHLDSPVEGINDSVMEAYRLLLKLNSLETELVRNMQTAVDASNETESLADGNLSEEVLTHALSLPWTLKGKHGLIALLLKYTDCMKLVSTSGHLFRDLLKCLSTNHLAPASTLVYRAILHQLNPQGTTDGFQQHCLPWLIQGLTSEDSLLRNNTTHYWLPLTLKHAPETYPLILSSLDSPNTKTFNKHFIVNGTVAVLKAGRAHDLLKVIPKKLLQQALTHQDDDIRLDAFGILCVSQKKAERLTQIEFDLLREFLPNNMTNDNAPFRQQLQASLRAMLMRLRDSALSFVRINKSELTQDTMEALTFLNWFWDLLMGSLFPGASYQRLKSALDWTVLVLDSFTYQPHRRQRKGTTPETVNHLMNIATSHGLCNFYSPTSGRLILACLLHGTDEIRNMTADVLLRFFPWPLDLDYAHIPPNVGHLEDNLTVRSKGHKLLQSGLKLCNSAKAHESESGALLIKMVFQKLVMEQGLVVSMSYSDGRFRVSDGGAVNDGETGAHMFLNQIVELIAESLEVTRRNVLMGAKQMPIHGFLLALRKCLSSKCVTFKYTELWRPLITRLIVVVSAVYDIVLEVLGGKVHSKDTAPSFEQMGIAIAATIAESTGEDLVDDVELLTNDHRVLMTWGWVNIKEASMLLGSLVEYLPLSTGSETEVLTNEEVIEIGNTFLKILTQCRHRGAIEGCNLGLAQYCEQLLQSSITDIHGIPGVMLEKVLDQITRSDINLSVTRRSAGLPLIITSILNSESKTRQSALLSKVMTTLLSISAKPIIEGDQRADMPQVHAMNILKAIMKEASIAMAARKYLARAVVVAIDGFASPHWAVRNAAMQLHGTLVTRMLGQKHTRDSQANLMTVPEFFAHYPILEDYFLSQLQASAADQKASYSGGLHLHPTTFPVLSLFARLGSGSETQNPHREENFRAAVEQFLSSAVLAIRDMAAQSLVSLTSVDKLENAIFNTIRKLPQKKDIFQANLVHGDILLCQHLLRRFGSSGDGYTESFIRTLLKELSMRAWIASPENHCTVVRAEYLELIMYPTRVSDHALPDELAMAVNSSVKDLLFSDCRSVEIMVGCDRILVPLVRWYLGVRRQIMCQERIVECLKCRNPDILVVTLESISKYIDEFPLGFQWNPTQVILWNILLLNPHCTLAAAVLEAVVSIYQRDGSLGLGHNRDAVWDYLINEMSREKNSRLASLALYVTSIILSLNLPDNLMNNLGHWCDVLTECHYPVNAEILHISAAKSLQQIASSVAVMLDQACPDQMMIDLAIRMFDVGLRLLVNESSQVRRAAADFVSHYQSKLNSTEQVQPLQPALAIQILCDVTFQQLIRTPALVRDVISKVRRKRPITELIECESKPYIEELFEAEEANYYKEDVVLASVLSEHLKSVSIEAMDTEYVVETLEDVIQNLLCAEPHLRENSLSEGPINVSFVQRVYECIWAELQVASVLVTALPQQNILRSKLVGVLEEYSNINDLHTHILGLVDRITKSLKGT